MKTPTIKTLDWRPHPAGCGGEQCKVDFDNGYAASVLRGGMFYTRGGTYEIAVLNEDGNLDYSTPITDDVLGYLTEAEADKALQDIAALPRREDAE